MLQYKAYKYFLRTIFVFGLAPLSMKKEKQNKSGTRVSIKLFLCKIIPMCVMLLNFSQFSLLLKMVEGTMTGLIHTLLFYAYFVLVIISNCVGCVLCLVEQTAYLSIISHIQQVECLFTVKFSKLIDYKTSHDSFKVKLMIIFSILLTATLTFFCINGWELDENVLLRTVVTILEIISSFVCLHLILYIDIVNLFVREMSNALKKPEKLFVPPVDILQKCKTLKKLKSIHLKLWSLVQKINLYFGWNLLFLLPKFFVDITYSLYWIFIVFQKFGWKSYTHIGNDSEIKYN